jgi:hypothetical protein
VTSVTPGDAAELEADQVAAKVVTGDRGTVRSNGSAAIHRDINDPGAKVATGEFSISVVIGVRGVGRRRLRQAHASVVRTVRDRERSLTSIAAFPTCRRRCFKLQ